jgi:hypothetical protein
LFFVIEVCNGASSSVARKPGNAAVRIYDLAAVVGRLAIELFKYSDAIRACSGVTVTDSDRKVGDRNVSWNCGRFDDYIVVAETVKFSKGNGSQLAFEIAKIVS